MLDQIEDTVAAYLPDSTAVYVNDATCRVFGKSRDELIGHRLFDVFPDARGNQFHLAFQKVVETRQPATFLHFYEPFAKLWDNRLYFADGLVWCVARDVTEEHATRARQDAARRRLEVLSEASRAFAAGAFDVRTTLARVAQSVGELLGDTCVIRLLASDGGGFEESIVWDVDPAVVEALTRFAPAAWSEGLAGRVVRERKPMLLDRVKLEELLSPISDGAMRDLASTTKAHSVVMAPLYVGDLSLGVMSLVRREGGNGEPFGDDDLVLLADLAGRAALAIANAKSYEESETARRRKDEFLALLGHELRNPLAPIVTALQLLKVRLGDAGAREREVIERQVRHMTQLVDDLLDISRITRGKLSLRPERVDIATVIARAVEMASPLLEERSHRLTTEVPSTPLFVDGDPTRLAQVFANLLTNAAKYTNAGGSIVISAVAANERVVVSVRDDGIGMLPELLATIFDPFVQGSRPQDRVQGGLGLGLPLVRSLVALHGGSVRATSAGPGQGSEFVVDLPAAGARAVPKPAPPVASIRATVPRRVLVVDDNVDACALLSDALSLLGHRVEVANDGLAAVSKAAAFEAEIAIVDIGLPVMDGYEVARRLREERPAMALAAVTGYGQDKDRALAMEAGFDAHFVKPVRLEDLTGWIEQQNARFARTGN